MIPVTLTIAGFDCSAGAGLQADLKTFTAFDCFGLTAATCIVSETPDIVTRIDAVDPDCLREQISLMLRSYPVAAIKLGMLYDLPQMQVVAELLATAAVAVICDPVMVASTGDPLFQESAMTFFQEKIVPLADVITPNLHEARVLAGAPLSDIAACERAALQLAERYGATCVLKGGHIDESSAYATDIIAAPDGQLDRLTAPRIDAASTHGTGCTFAAAMAASIARGRTHLAAAREAKAFVTHAISTAHRWTSHRISAINQRAPHPAFAVDHE